MPSRLKSLELLGYKTFATKSQFLFGEKITAVVGTEWFRQIKHRRRDSLGVRRAIVFITARKKPKT